MVEHAQHSEQQSSRQHDAWQLLMSYGMPDGPLRPLPMRPFDEAAVRQAVETVAVAHTSLEPARRDALLAWLEAWRHHWPGSFARVLGDLGTSFADELREGVLDAGRVLKLRRIAIENLSGLL